MATATASAATRRLLRDLREIRSEASSLTTINALPQENNLFRWHCNLRPADGPFAGVVFHIILVFTEQYPHKPPEVQLCTYLSHPNVFHGWSGPNQPNVPYICLDMLKDHTKDEAYAGWTSAYSVLSLLLQLQSFLFAENIPQEYGGTRSSMADKDSVDRSRKAAEEFSCQVDDEHVHSFASPWPPLPMFEEQVQSGDSVNITVSSQSCWLRHRRPHASAPYLSGGALAGWGGAGRLR